MHNHSAKSIRNLPFGDATLSTCSCGARMRSDGAAIAGGVQDGTWYVMQAPSARDEAYARLQSEGHSEGPEPVDPADEFYAGRE